MRKIMRTRFFFSLLIKRVKRSSAVEPRPRAPAVVLGSSEAMPAAAAACTLKHNCIYLLLHLRSGGLEAYCTSESIALRYALNVTHNCIAPVTES